MCKSKASVNFAFLFRVNRELLVLLGGLVFQVAMAQRYKPSECYRGCVWLCLGMAKKHSEFFP